MSIFKFKLDPDESILLEIKLFFQTVWALLCYFLVYESNIIRNLVPPDQLAAYDARFHPIFGIWIVYVMSFILILGVVARLTNNFILCFSWAFFEVVFWGLISYSLVFNNITPFPLSAGFCAIFCGTALYILSHLIVLYIKTTKVIKEVVNGYK